MGLISPRSPGSNNKTNLDIQYGTGLIHFYLNLGGEAPRDWQILYLFPPPTNTSVGSETAVTSEPPPCPKHPLSIVEPTYSSGDLDELTDEDEGNLPCSCCLIHHDDPCPSPISTSIPFARSLDNVSSKWCCHGHDRCFSKKLN
jgi:hypothetical protein